jgi:hypothetical protein
LRYSTLRTFNFDITIEDFTTTPKSLEFAMLGHSDLTICEGLKISVLSETISILTTVFKLYSDTIAVTELFSDLIEMIKMIPETSSIHV